MSESLMALMKKGGSGGQYEVIEGYLATSTAETFTISSNQNKTPMYAYAEIVGATVRSFAEWDKFDPTHYKTWKPSQSGYNREVGSASLISGVNVMAINNDSITFTTFYAESRYIGTGVRYILIFE